MEEEKRMIEAARALGLGELAPEVYRDMLQPAARQLGDGLATVAKAVKISLAPLEAGVWGYERIREWLSLRATRILADRGTKSIEPPPLSIAGPLVVQLMFAQDEPDLKELYASLLASAMDRDERAVHPSFVSIIQQLTSDEAKILRRLAQFEKWPSLSANAVDGGSATPSVEQQFNAWCEQSGVTHPERSETYLDNLIRLRIFVQLDGNEARFEPADQFGDYDAYVSNDVYQVVQLTAFGRLFLDACIEKTKPNKRTEGDV